MRGWIGVDMVGIEFLWIMNNFEGELTVSFIHTSHITSINNTHITHIPYHTPMTHHSHTHHTYHIIHASPHSHTAQVTEKQGRRIARNLNRLAKGKEEQPFVYHFKGAFVYTGLYTGMMCDVCVW